MLLSIKLDVVLNFTSCNLTFSFLFTQGSFWVLYPPYPSLKTVLFKLPRIKNLLESRTTCELIINTIYYSIQDF